MNTISKCLFGGALLGAGLSSPAIGGDVVWGSGSSNVFSSSHPVYPSGIGYGNLSSGIGNWNVSTGIGPYGSSASSVGTALGLSMLTYGGAAYGSASVDHYFTVTHDMLISFEWDFTGAGIANMQITDSLNTSIFNQSEPSFSSVPLELSFMAGETYHINGYLFSFSDIFRFTMTGGSDINVVPIPPAAFGGLAMLAGLGAYRRVRR